MNPDPNPIASVLAEHSQASCHACLEQLDVLTNPATPNSLQATQALVTRPAQGPPGHLVLLQAPSLPASRSQRFAAGPTYDRSIQAFGISPLGSDSSPHRLPHPPTDTGQSLTDFIAFDWATGDGVDLGFCRRHCCGFCRASVRAKHQPTA